MQLMLIIVDVYRAGTVLVGILIIIHVYCHEQSVVSFPATYATKLVIFLPINISIRVITFMPT